MRITHAHNGKIDPARLRVPAASDRPNAEHAGFVRSSHSLSTALTNKLRKLAFKERTSASAVVECAVWTFFDRGYDTNFGRMMRNAGIEPRPRRRP